MIQQGSCIKVSHDYNSMQCCLHRNNMIHSLSNLYIMGHKISTQFSWERSQNNLKKDNYNKVKAQMNLHKLILCMSSIEQNLCRLNIIMNSSYIKNEIHRHRLSQDRCKIMIGYELVRMKYRYHRMMSWSKLDRYGCIDRCSSDLVNNIQNCKSNSNQMYYSLRNFQINS